jgi:hypothetical protein
MPTIGKLIMNSLAHGLAWAAHSTCASVIGEIVSLRVHLFLLPNPQRWKRALARGELSKPLNDNDFLPRFLH